MICKKCGAEIADSAAFCNSCGEKINAIQSNTVNDKFAHLTNEAKRDMKEKLGNLCNSAIFLAFIMCIQNLFGDSQEGTSMAWINWIPSYTWMAFSAIVDVCIYRKLRTYFSSLRSLITMYICTYTVAVLFLGLSEVVGDNLFLGVSGVILGIVALVCQLLLGVKLKKQYTDHRKLGNLFIAPLIVGVVGLLLMSISEDLEWLMTVADAVVSIMIYRAISKTVKTEIV